MARCLTFTLIDRKPKTSVFSVTPITDGAFVLGVVKWFARWRNYCFFPNGDTVLDKSCLREIADFCERQGVSQRAKKKE